MSTGARLVGAIAAGLGVVALAGCLEMNPMWAGLSDGASGTGDTSGATTLPMTTEPATSAMPTTIEPTTTIGSSGPPPPACGDGSLDPGEECDDGPKNGDDAACTASCTYAACGDGLVCTGCGEECDDGAANGDAAACTGSCKSAACGDGLAQDGVEECDDGNAVDTDACTGSCKKAACGDGVVQAGVEMCDDMNGLDTDGCVACVIPKSCKEIKAKSPGATDGVYKIDLDGEGGMMPVPVECDMTIDGGGWTVVEKSPLAAPIGTALFVDKPINEGDPMMMQYRAPKAIMIALQAGATLMRIDCNGPDYLLTDDMSLFAGEMLPNSCMQVIGVTFKEASLAGAMVTNKAICVQLRGVGDNPACPAAFGISEVDQMPCGLMSLPFGGPKLGQGAFAFAMDSPFKDTKHDCHKPGASRFVILR